MTNSSAPSIQQGNQTAQTTATKKTGKHSAAKILSELFSHIQQTKPAGKSGIVSFKKILEPAKEAKIKATAEPDDSGVAATTSKRLQKKKTEVICVSIPSTNGQAQVSNHPNMARIADSSEKHANHKAVPLQKPDQTQTNIKPTIDPRSPMHGKVVGNKDSGRILITDGPKAEKEPIVATRNNPVAPQGASESNAGSTKPQKLVRPFVEPRAASDNASVNSANTISRTQITPIQTAFGQAVELPKIADINNPGNRAKASVIKAIAKGSEKADNHEKFNTEVNGRNLTAKQTKSVQANFEVAQKVQAGEHLADAAGAKVIKNDVSMTNASEQFAVGTFSNAGPANANNVANTPNSTANIHEQVVSVAAAASHKIGKKITVNLNPPELGRISIKFEKNGDEVTGRVEVEKSQTKHQIDVNVTQIVQNLQDSGVQLKRLDVVLQDRTFENQKEFAGNTQPDWNDKQQFAADKDHSDVRSSITAGDQFSYMNSNETYFSDKSVNILI